MSIGNGWKNRPASGCPHPRPLSRERERGVVRRILIGAAVLLGISWLGSGSAAVAQSESGSTLEKKLLGDLRADPLDDEVDRELFAPDERPAAPGQRPAERPKEPEKTPEALDMQLLRELGPAAVSGDEDPLVDVARQMRTVQGRIRRSDSGEATQDLQGAIVGTLEELLKQARSRCGSAGKPRESQPQQVASREPIEQPEPQKPADEGKKSGSKKVRNPQGKAGTAAAQRPDMGQMRDLLKQIWGELPPGQRQQMIELPVEEFLPKYELMIEAYFKRLASPQETDRWPQDTLPPR